MIHQAGKTANQYKGDEIPAVAEGSNPDLVVVEEEKPEHDDGDWLAIARDAYQTSDDYFDASIRAGIERNMAHFAGRHAPGSKYYTDLYKYRAKGFRPKTRSVIRKNEAAAAVALFSTSDSVNVAAENDGIPEQVVSAEINQELLTYRLNDTVPWFQLAMGAYQDALTAGVCISHQHWNYQEAEEEELILDEDGLTIIDNETGEPAIGIRRSVTKDTPAIELRPVENIRFAPSAKWEDPLNTSPYLIDMIPMEIGDLKEKMKQTGKTKIPWRELDEGQLKQGMTEQYDPIRAQREGKRQDSKDQTHAMTDFDTVWVHRNIVRKKGVDYVYYTLGTHYMLSDPILLIKEYPHLKHGMRPYVLGTAIIETHKTHPESLAGLSSNLQQEANDINNQRRDNVQLVLNRRYYARRGAQIDYKSLINNVPGSVTEMDNVSTDIRSEAPPEVTGSSYQEQDRINMDFDELTGAFSTSSVGSNRQLNETVGGMEMMNAQADSVTEYQLRTFVETWAKPVLKQLIQLEQRHETDEGLLSMVGNKIKSWQRFGIDRVTDAMLQGSMTVEINVGFGSTNPKQRIEKLATGLDVVYKYIPAMAQRASGDEIAKEIFGALGYQGSERFFPPTDPNNPPKPAEDPRVAAEKMRAQSTMQIKQFEAQTNMQMLEKEAQMKRMDMEYQRQRDERDQQLKYAVAEMQRENQMMELAGKREMSLEQIKQKLADTSIKERGANQRFMAEKEFAMTAGNGRGL